LVIGFLAILEGALSIDNALVLGLLAKRLKKEEQGQALNIGMFLAFCSGVPHWSMAVAHRLLALMAMAMPAQPQVNSSVTTIWVSRSLTPPPPYSSG